MHPSFVRSRALRAPLALALVATWSLAASPLATSPLGAQRAPRPGGSGRAAAASAKATVFDVTPYAGYMRFGQHLDGPLGTSLRSASAPVVGAQLGLALGPNVGIVGNVAYGSADLEVGLPILGGIDVGTSRHLVYDANLELRVPLPGGGRTPVTPFVQAGAGAIRTHLENALLKTSTTNFAFNGGAGLDLALGRGFGARLMVKDYVGRFDPRRDTGVPVRGDVTHNVAGSLGVRLSF